MRFLSSVALNTSVFATMYVHFLLPASDVLFFFLQNMIDGLGITGYEGVFLRVSEITLSILRAHRETLVSVLETFIHDPLVEWTKTHKSSGVEVQNPHAQVLRI